ncbi:MAG TPA: 4-hydroxyphenylpyruvate dioxygenase [Acidimicrobiia bacterium]|nr:4-hydroxyphenylpyruvate dioxygenase [Acidimicrobiia bacterium]
MSDAVDAHKNDFPIKGFHHIEFWVGNAYQSAHFYRAIHGYSIVGYRGPETGHRETASYALEQGDVRMILTGAMGPDHPIADHLKLHGPGVRDVAVHVPDAEAAFEIARDRGADVAYKPEVLEDDRGTWRTAGITAYGDTIHSLVENEDLVWPPPGYRVRSDSFAQSIGLERIDHVVANVELGQMNEWVEFYERVFGFVLLRHFDDEAISTEYSALMSKVVWDGSGVIRLPINEPAQGKRKSQIEEYLEFYRGSGVQHIAIQTSDLVETVAEARRRGMGLMSVPDTYYDDVLDRVPDLEVDVETIKRLSILVDQDDHGHLLQIFTRMMQDRPTVFYEFIERRGALGFGEGNFKALFEAIERDQAERGNL